MPDSKRTSLVDATLATATAKAIPCAAGGGSPVPIVDPNHTWDSSTKTHTVKGLALVTAAISAVEVAGGFVYAHVDTTAGAIVGRFAAISGLTASAWLNGVLPIDAVLAAPARLQVGNVAHADQAPTADAGTAVWNPQTGSLERHQDGAGTDLAFVDAHGTLNLRQPAYGHRPNLDIRRQVYTGIPHTVRYQSPTDTPGDNGTFTWYFDDGGSWYNVVVVCASGKKTGTGDNFRIIPPTVYGMPNVIEANLQAYSDCAAACVLRDGCSGLGAGTSMPLIVIDDLAGQFSHGLTPAGQLVWGATTALDAGGLPAWDTFGPKRLAAGSVGMTSSLTISVAGNNPTQFTLTNPDATVNGVWNWKIGGPGQNDGDLKLLVGATQLARYSDTGVILPTGKSLYLNTAGSIGAETNGNTVIYLNGSSQWIISANTTLTLGVQFNTSIEITAAGVSVQVPLTIGSGGAPISRVPSATAPLDFPSVAAGGQQELTIAVTGATTDGKCSVELGPPAGIVAGLVWGGRVSAADTVTVRVSNITGSPIDPASATWRATVTKFA